MIVNRQRRVRVSVRSLARFLSRVRKTVKLPPESFTLCLVTNHQIKRWNSVYRKKDKPTDVLSFPANGVTGVQDGSSEAYLGDIAIAPAVALQNAKRFGRTLDEEMRILILHGVLHLMGYDHETDRGEMDRIEARLRQQLELV